MFPTVLFSKTVALPGLRLFLTTGNLLAMSVSLPCSLGKMELCYVLLRARCKETIDSSLFNNTTSLEFS